MTISTSTIKYKFYLNFMFSDSLIQDEVFTIFLEGNLSPPS